MVKFTWYKMIKLPFAALHGDPDILENGKTRFGPTALSIISS